MKIAVIGSGPTAADVAHLVSKGGVGSELIRADASLAATTRGGNESSDREGTGPAGWTHLVRGADLVFNTVPHLADPARVIESAIGGGTHCVDIGGNSLAAARLFSTPRSLTEHARRGSLPSPGSDSRPGSPPLLVGGLPIPSISSTTSRSVSRPSTARRAGRPVHGRTCALVCGRDDAVDVHDVEASHTRNALSLPLPVDDDPGRAVVWEVVAVGPP